MLTCPAGQRTHLSSSRSSLNHITIFFHFTSASSTAAYLQRAPRKEVRTYIGWKIWGMRMRVPFAVCLKLVLATCTKNFFPIVSRESQFSLEARDFNCAREVKGILEINFFLLILLASLWMLAREEPRAVNCRTQLLSLFHQREAPRRQFLLKSILKFMNSAAFLIFFLHR